MKNGARCWELFCRTGIPVFYLTYRMEKNGEHLV